MPPDMLKILIQLLQDPDNKFTMLLAGRGLSEFMKDIQKMIPKPGLAIEGRQQPGVNVTPSAQNVPPGLVQQLGGPQPQLASNLAQMVSNRRGTGMLGGGRI